MKSLFTTFAFCLTACASSAESNADSVSTPLISATTENVPQLAFRTDWSITETAPLLAGGFVDIIYDIARQPGCRRAYNGLPAWAIWANYRIDDGRVAQAALTELANGVQHVIPARIRLPLGTRKLSIWFESSSIGGCHTYDSNFGLDYTFDVE